MTRQFPRCSISAPYLEVSVAIVSSQAVAIASSMGVASSGRRVHGTRRLELQRLGGGGNRLQRLCRALEPAFPAGFEPAQVGTASSNAAPHWRSVANA